ncbi:ATPase family protein 2 homolog [Teleopsis dalmanni]|uniref:ATPase family protein 2 homolog n=1 Tax=Teleopsis dalmanni TaxID=139649 RepID=UPI0018CD634D|nr:ATPase family protein 2 homolog [Teleopsis dalmanni]
MPPKSSNKKPNAPSWFHCECCDVHITAKDREKHEKVCPIGENAVKCDSTPLEYIRDGCLFTATIERQTLSIAELQQLPDKYVNNQVFISEGAMQLAGFYIGQYVSISVPGSTESPILVRSVWPMPEKFLTTVFVTNEDLKLCWQSLRDCVVKVEKLPNDFASAAQTVVLQLQEPEGEFTEPQIKDIERLLRQHMKNLIFAPNNIINYNFYNKTLKLKVVKWFRFEDQDNAEKNSLEAAFENLTLHKRGSNDFFRVIIATYVKVLTQTHNTDSEGSIRQKITVADIGGLDHELETVMECIDLALGFKFVPYGLQISRGILLYGSSGCGKTMICEAMCNRVLSMAVDHKKTYVIKINPSELFSKFLGETEQNLHSYFKQAFDNYPEPTLIIIEDLHNLCPQNDTNEIIKRVSMAFLSILDELNTKKEAQKTFILATTSQANTLNVGVRRCGRLDSEIEINVPTPKARIDILKRILRNVEHNLTNEEVEEIANITHAFVGADLGNLLYNATAKAFKNNRTKLEFEDVTTSLSHVKPSAMREVLIECPNVRWTDIGGQADLKLKLQQAIEWPLQHPEKFERLGIKPPRGVLMFGPPGCSKTMIAKALATESKVNFISIKGPELFSMWVGESERAVREVFRKARQVSPAIVFFDEIDAISSERADSGSGTSVKERVLTQLLTELDGVEALHNVTIVAATNRPDMIDKALLRPGRFDRIIYVGLPDARARREIFSIKLHRMPIAKDVDLDALVEQTTGYSGAEIQAVCNEAALKTLDESFEAQHVENKHFTYALNAVKPRTSPELLRLYDVYLTRQS